ncbi:MAG: prolyl oligopeptidase family serine peptidase [Propionibacteriaceae bacterium]|nr:prolyl oligopeptidase family serine peptidase [Propionibacteriaceae bacterium]
MTLLPYGQWPSPIGVADVARGRRRLGDGFINHDHVYWLQSDPTDKGRTTLVTVDASGRLVDLTPNRDVRTTIHEYGGSAAAMRHSQVCFYDRSSKRVWIRQADGTTRPLTDAPRWVYGGFTFLNDHRVVCVREDHDPDASEPRDSLVILDTTGDNPTGGRVVASGADFYFCPAVSHTGWIAWMEYDHPSMPWGSTRIMALAPDQTLHTVAATPNVAAVYPQWDADGSLVFLSDESGYWNFHRWRAGRVTRLHDHPYDFCGPSWVLSQPPYALLDGPAGTTIGCSWWSDGDAHLGRLSPDGRLTQIGVFGTATVAPASNGVSVVGLATATEAYTVHTLDWTHQRLTRIATESEVTIPPARISHPEQIRWTGEAGDVVGWFYPPTTPAGAPWEGPAPVIVMSHGGPTTFSPGVFSPVTQYFATRGIGVLDVNYSGSSAMGRAYRERLDGNWGIRDVQDCVDGALALIHQGRADAKKVAIMGGSAGGFTTLSALTTSDVFSAGISLYGVADLEALARDTTKFESHYTDALVAPYPAERATYIQRSPISRVEALSCPILLLQGSHDPVVPPNQAVTMYTAVRSKGLPAQLVLYEGEGHGFRLASTIEDVYTRILVFLSHLWGFTANPRAT